MLIKFIMKSGADFTVECESVSRDPENGMFNMNGDMSKLPIYINMDDVSAIIPVTNKV